MPVTAKLSRRVYEKLGDDVANAIVEWFNAVDATYKADLRELNDLNFARFDAKVGERFAQVNAEMAKRFAQADAKLEQRFAQVDVKLEQRLGQVERSISDLEVRLTRRMYAVSTATFLAQIVALVTLLRFFVVR